MYGQKKTKEMVKHTWVSNSRSYHISSLTSAWRGKKRKQLPESKENYERELQDMSCDLQ